MPMVELAVCVVVRRFPEEPTPVAYGEVSITQLPYLAPFFDRRNGHVQ